ncbi:GIY-YIG nuclease family protein [Vibrio gazogenes]|uniref:Methionine sulfoxide reductase n=1 Tax=Vibrio gazogenes TaxID=687 RepID=A0A1Z2SH76_VIBGA|nr:GIY-YIG nuclease family protein [Vibrio gazogenes]ASA56518.1 methionine sulfoxide reductase [Vibrio gazogenes]
MAEFGRSIRIFFADGSPTGLRHVEIVNWSGQAMACPRTRFFELKHWDEVKRPGVYFLLEKASGDDDNVAYIGESEDVFRRLANHDREKDFWNEVIIFSSKDENLTKAHIKYLEARLVEMSQAADRYTVSNSNCPTKSGLPRADMAAMEEFIENIKLVLGSLGHRLLEPIASSSTTEIESNESLTHYPLTLTVNKLQAYGRMTDDGFLLAKGSQIAKRSSQSMPGKSQQIKQEMIDSGVLIERENWYELLKDKLMSSSSYAACLVSGNSRSGPQSWRTELGESLKELEARLVGKDG